MFLLFAVFALAFQRFTYADSGLPENKYPGLTIAEARCPESARDENYWYIIPGFNNTFGCFGVTNLPANIDTFEGVKDACREKHKDAVPARFRTDYNYDDYRSLTYNAVIGASFTANDSDAKISSGLHVPYRGPWNKAESWQNTDGTPADFVPWHIYEPNNGDDERNVLGYGADLMDFNGNHDHAHHVVCKKAAVKIDLSKDVKRYDVFKVNGKRCRFERATHWNRQCPTNSSLWQIVPSDEGVHCYALVDAPVPLSNYNFKHEICHSLHPQAKLASIHYDRQFSFLYPLANHANNVVVGLVRNNESFEWSDDGTPVNTGFWAPSEPSGDPTNAVVRIQFTKKATPYLSTMDRPLFKTMRFEEVGSDMNVACKINAEPLIPCLPVPDTGKMESLNDAICPTGWTKQRFCGKVFCYQQVSVKQEDKTFGNTVEKDYCDAHYPGSHLASIHCVEEHYFVQNYSPKTLIGLHIPTTFHSNAFDVKNFEWTDGTPVDFVGWNRFSHPETGQYAPLFPTNVNENVKFYQVYNKFDDITSGWSNQFGGFESVLCKTHATAKQDH